VSIRLPEDDRKQLEESIANNQLIEGLDDGAFLRIEMTMFLIGLPVLSQIKGALLCDLADRMKIVQLKENDIYKLSGSEEIKPVIVVAEGSIELEYNEAELITLQKGDIFGELFVLDTHIEAKKIKALSDNAIIFSIASNEYYQIIGDNHKLAQDMIASVSSKFETETTLNS
ncbi:MAG: hypothetical protein OEY51_10090, partial [Cyclobacteriaceae bacterium]|nr:hypothetical protein [Cyclobacteriaceae bacterium]